MGFIYDCHEPLASFPLNFELPSLVFIIVAVETHSNHKDGGCTCGKLRSLAE